MPRAERARRAVRRIVPSAAFGRWRPALKALGVAALAGVIAVGVLQAAFGIPWTIWPFAIFWMVALFAFVVLLRALILPMLKEKWAETRFE